MAQSLNSNQFKIPIPKNKKGETSVYLFLFFLLLYFITARGKPQNVDEVAMYSTLINFMNTKSLAIDELDELNQGIDQRIAFPGREGHLYSKYSPGNILIAILLYWGGELVMEGLGSVTSLYINVFLGSVTLLLIYKFLRRYFDNNTCLLTVIFVGLCSTWWYQSRGFGLEIGGGLFLFTSFYLATGNQFALSTFFWGISLFFRTLNGITFPILALGLKKINKKDKYLGLVIMIVLGGILLSYNWIRFGSILNFGYNNVGFSTPFFTGFHGLLFSPGRSIFIYSPIFLLAIPGTYYWYKIDKWITTILVLTIFVYIGFLSTWVSWDSGWSWGSRLFTPMIPLVGVLIAPMVSKAFVTKSWYLILSFTILTSTGLFLEVLTLFQDPLITLKNAVIYNGIPYEKTLYTWKYSMINLQMKILREWIPSKVDSLFLKIFLGLK